MDNLLTEQQQIDTIKQWWKKHGKFVLAVTALIIAANVGWQAWRHHQNKALIHASNHYEWLLDGVVSNNPLVVQTQSRYILNRYPATPYALFAALMQARQAIYENDFLQAEEKLLWVMENASSNSLKQVARVRASRVMLTEKKADKALTLLNKIDDENYLPAILILRGDIYAAMDQKPEAKEAYQKASQLLNDQDASQPLLQMKLDDLA